jgi:hypothetical protein
MLGVAVPSVKALNKIYIVWLKTMPKIRYTPRVVHEDGTEEAARADVDIMELLEYAVRMAQQDGVLDEDADVIVKLGIDGTSVCCVRGECFF